MLATRHMLRDYIYDAISNQNTGAQDTLALEEEAD
jgi:hypothetical protein